MKKGKSKIKRKRNQKKSMYKKLNSKNLCAVSNGVNGREDMKSTPDSINCIRRKNLMAYDIVTRQTRQCSTAVLLHPGMIQMTLQCSYIKE